jgi:3',5'-cyclic AMP phosphodiesterase CpdA
VSPAAGGLYAISDLHIAYQENRRYVEQIRPQHEDDWLIVAGDVAETVADIEWALRLLRERFATVVWVPGNHELWTARQDPVQLRGDERYRHLVALAQRLGVVTPEDPYPMWTGEGGPVLVVPLFLLYDYTFYPAGATSKEEGLAQAYAAGVICRDEYVLHPDPWPSRDAWCRDRVAQTERRLAERDPALPTVLVNHFPLVREPTRILRYPEFAQWCGTESTHDWHTRFNAVTVVYGHLHIPRAIAVDGVPFEEVSLGYPREWQPRAKPPDVPRRILPRPKAL